MNAALIECKDVTIELGGEVILKDVNLSIYQGETVVLIGTSGGGKSVLLKTLAGLINPVQGYVTCWGKKWTELSVIGKHDLYSHVGMQFQKSALFDELSVIENVAYPLREHTRMSEDEIQARALECLKQVSLEKARNMETYDLSGGMKIRLGVARSIALKPEILFLDDPTAGLDPVNSDEMAELLLNIKKNINSTMIIVTHDISRAYQLAGRIFLIGNRMVKETGSAQQTRDSKDPSVQQFIHGWLKGPLTDGNQN
ncbi:MAG: ATP-binding cassette domain-containing protein [Bdellovibrionaceae bacterium]|nr:ATP-binding cassette domain-containing protein [Pseudobdellovibrionaceae bacterium]